MKPRWAIPLRKLYTPSFKIIESCSLSRYADINSLLCCKTQAAHHITLSIRRLLDINNDQPPERSIDPVCVCVAIEYSRGRDVIIYEVILLEDEV